MPAERRKMHASEHMEVASTHLRAEDAPAPAAGGGFIERSSDWSPGVLGRVIT